jgi:endonuclease/exonuclease/phosphatase family metal-dependent hydrolase
MRLVYSVLIVCISMVSCGSIRNYKQLDGPKFCGKFSGEATSSDSLIKVITFNIKFAEHIDQACGELNRIEELNPADIMFLQEMDEDGTKYIAGKIGFNYLYYPAVFHRHKKNFGNAILSKWPLTDEHKIILPWEHPLNNQIRIAVAATIFINKIPVRLYSVHTEVAMLDLERRLDQVKTILKSIPDSIHHVIVGGDFNTMTTHDLKRLQLLMQREQFFQATETIPYTFKAGPFDLIQLNLDHIFVRGLAVRDVGIYKNSEASDHLPVWVELSIN